MSIRIMEYIIFEYGSEEVENDLQLYIRKILCSAFPIIYFWLILIYRTWERNVFVKITLQIDKIWELSKRFYNNDISKSLWFSSVNFL